MRSCKSLVILLLLPAVSIGQRHDNIPCQPLPSAPMIHRESTTRSFEWWGYVSELLHITVDDNIIGCVHAHDQRDDGTGGYAEIVGGGIGYNYVDVNITSQFNRGYSFVIEVFGQDQEIVST